MFVLVIPVNVYVVIVWAAASGSDYFCFGLIGFLSSSIVVLPFKHLYNVVTKCLSISHCFNWVAKA